MNRTQRTLVTGLSSLALLGGGFAASSAQATTSATTGANASSSAAALADSQTCTLSYRGFSCNASVEARLRAGLTKHATLYRGKGYTGKRLTRYGVGTCSPTYGDNEGRLVLNSWSDTVSSVKTFNKCDVKLRKKVNGKWQSTTWIDHSYDLRLHKKWANHSTHAWIS